MLVLRVNVVVIRLCLDWGSASVGKELSRAAVKCIQDKSTKLRWILSGTGAWLALRNSLTEYRCCCDPG